MTASSEIFNVTSIKNAGYPVVTWTVNTKERMLELMKLGVNGIISDRPDLLREALKEFDANNDGTRVIISIPTALSISRSSTLKAIGAGAVFARKHPAGDGGSTCTPIHL